MAEAKPRSLRTRFLGALVAASAMFGVATTARAQDSDAYANRHNITTSPIGAPDQNAPAAAQQDEQPGWFARNITNPIFGESSQVTALKTNVKGLTKALVYSSSAVDSEAVVIKDQAGKLIEQYKQNDALLKENAKLKADLKNKDQVIGDQRQALNNDDDKVHNLETQVQTLQDQVSGLTKAKDAFLNLVNSMKNSASQIGLSLKDEAIIIFSLIGAFIGGAVLGRITRPKAVAAGDTRQATQNTVGPVPPAPPVSPDAPKSRKEKALAALSSVRDRAGNIFNRSPKERVQIQPITAGLPKDFADQDQSAEALAAAKAKRFTADNNNMIATPNVADQALKDFSPEQQKALEAFTTGYGIAHSHRYEDVSLSKGTTGRRYFDAHGNATFTVSPRHMEIHKFNDDAAQKNAVKLAFSMYGANLAVSPNLQKEFEAMAQKLAAAGELTGPDGEVIKLEDIIINDKNIELSPQQQALDLQAPALALGPDATISLDAQGHGQLRNLAKDFDVNNKVDPSIVNVDLSQGNKTSSVDNKINALDEKAGPGEQAEAQILVIPPEATPADIRGLAEAVRVMDTQGQKVRVAFIKPEHHVAFTEAYKEAETNAQAAALQNQYSFAGQGEYLHNGQMGVDFAPTDNFPTPRNQLRKESAATAIAEQQNERTRIALKPDATEQDIKQAAQDLYDAQQRGQKVVVAPGPHDVALTQAYADIKQAHESEPGRVLSFPHARREHTLGR